MMVMMERGNCLQKLFIVTASAERQLTSHFSYLAVFQIWLIKTRKNVLNNENEEKERILAWAEEGLSGSEIAACLGHHKCSVNRLISKFVTASGDAVPERQVRSGRPRKVTNTLLTMLKRQIEKYLMMTTTEIKQCAGVGRAVRQQVQRALQKYLKMPSRSAAQKPLLAPKMKKKRLQFAKAYRHFTVDDWRKFMFSDESTFRVIRSTKMKVRCSKESDRGNSKFTMKTVKHPESVMVWGYFSGAGEGIASIFCPKTPVLPRGRNFGCITQKGLYKNLCGRKN
jgi:transposase